MAEPRFGYLLVEAEDGSVSVVAGRLIAPIGSVRVADADAVELLIPAVRTQTQIDALSPPPTGVLFYNSTTGKMQFYDGTQWIVLGEGGGGVIGVTPAANVSWESDNGVTGSPASAWESLDTTVTLAQSTSGSRPAVTGSAFGSTTGLTFDGVNDYLTVATKVVTETGSATVSIVFKTAATVTGPQVLVSQSDTAVANEWFEVGISVDGKLYVESNNAGTKHTVNGSTVLLPSTIYNVILCYDGTDYFMLLNSAEENPLTIESVGAFAWFGQTSSTTPAFTVGATITSGGTSRYFEGVVGGIYFWDEDLTA